MHLVTNNNNNMSTKWHGGKGDKSRTNNYNKYADNYNNIFGTRAKATDDIWGEPGQVDIIEGDTISYRKTKDNFINVVVVVEAPGKYGEAGGNAGHPFNVTQNIFEEKYKPYLKIL